MRCGKARNTGPIGPCRCSPNSGGAARPRVITKAIRYPHHYLYGMFGIYRGEIEASFYTFLRY